MPVPPQTDLPVAHTALILIEVDDPLLLAELRADPRISPLLLHQLSEKVVLVAPSASGDILARLRSAGHTPRVLT